jgi:hypothetical protein
VNAAASVALKLEGRRDWCGARGSARCSLVTAISSTPRRCPPCGDVVALIATNGTKALVLTSDGRLIREVDRS